MKSKRRNRKWKRGRGKSKSGQPLHGASTGTATYVDTAKQGGLILLTAIAAGGAGAALGKHSLIAGIPITLVGIHKKNPYVVAAGLGLTLSNGFQKPGQTTQGVDGFDIKQITAQAKDRIGTFFQNFKEKLYLAPAPTSTAGLEGENDEQVTYFVNPYNGTGEIDMSAIDRVQEKIAEMNRSDTSGLNEIEREF